MTLVAPMELNETETTATEEKPRPKVGRIPVTLRMLNENEGTDTADAWPEADMATRKGDTQFMLLLVALFIIVNLTLITLISHKDKAAPAKAETASTQPRYAPAAATPPAAAPVTSVPVAVQALPPAQAAATAPAPVIPAPTPAAANAYVTPASPDTTRTIAAPFQPVSVVDHTHAAATAPVAAASVAADDHLTVVHPAAPAVTGAPETISPAAGTPAVSPEAAKQDLLSVINKD